MLSEPTLSAEGDGCAPVWLGLALQDLALAGDGVQLVRGPHGGHAEARRAPSMQRRTISRYRGSNMLSAIFSPARHVRDACAI